MVLSRPCSAWLLSFASLSGDGSYLGQSWDLAPQQARFEPPVLSGPAKEVNNEELELGGLFDVAIVSRGPVTTCPPAHLCQADRNFRLKWKARGSRSWQVLVKVWSCLALLPRCKYHLQGFMTSWQNGTKFVFRTQGPPLAGTSLQFFPSPGMELLGKLDPLSQLQWSKAGAHMSL